MWENSWKSFMRWHINNLVDGVCTKLNPFHKQFTKDDVDLWPRDLKSTVPPLITNNLHLKFASDRSKTVACIMPTRFHTQSAKDDINLWPRDSKSIRFPLSSSTIYIWSLKTIGLQSVSCPQSFIYKIDRVPPLIIHSIHMKFESDWSKTLYILLN